MLIVGHESCRMMHKAGSIQNLHVFLRFHSASAYRVFFGLKRNADGAIGPCINEEMLPVPSMRRQVRLPI
jgi:hypothetical protein